MPKKQMPELSLQKVKLNGKELRKYFPTALPERTEAHVYLKDKTPIGYFGTEFLPNSFNVTAHAYIPFKARTKENLDLIRDGFYTEYHPWLQSKGIKEIIVTCNINNDGAKRFQELLGFNLHGVWIGGMPVKEDYGRYR